MRRVAAIGLVLVLVAAMTACRVISISPVGTTVGQRIDSRLVGHWVDAKSGKNPMDVSPQKDGSLRVAMCAQDTPKSCKFGYWRVWSTELGKYRYLDVVKADEKGNPIPPGPQNSDFSVPGHEIYAYDIDARDVLNLYEMDDNLTTAAIKAGRIAGFVKPDKYSEIGPEVILTAPPAALDGFLATPEGRKLFRPVWLRWKKDGSAAPDAAE